MRTHETSARPRLRLLAAACLYAALGIAAQRHLVRAGLGSHVYQQNMLGQDCLLHAWTIAWDQHALATNACATGDANIFAPERGTLFYSDHLLGQALLTAPLRLVTDNALLVHNTLVVAAPALDALALFALALEVGATMPAAVVAGLVYGFVPLRFLADACQIQMTAAWWMPLVLLGGLRAVRDNRRRWGVVAGLGLLGQGLSGIYLTTFFTPFLALAHLVWWRRHPLRAAPHGWTALVGSEMAAAALLAPTALAYHGVQAHLGSARSPFLNAILSLHWPMLAEHVPGVTLTVLAALALARPHDLPRRFRHESPLFVAMFIGGLVLSLGPALPLPYDLGTIPGPYRLLVGLPGFTALRVPARMLHVALLGASVLAAGGIMVLRQVAWRRPVAVTLTALLALATESPPRTLAVIRIERPEHIDPVYRWLATAPGTGAIVELPPDPTALATSVRQYASTAHWQPSLQGTSGIEPPMYAWMSARLAEFPAPDVVTDLVALGVRRAIVHSSLVPPTMRTALERAARERRLLKPRWRRGATVVYALRPSLSPARRTIAGRPLERTAWRATASAAAVLAPLAVDDDPASGWRSWGDLDASVQHLGYHPLPILERWKAFLATTPATLTIDLGRTTSVATILLHLGGSDPMMLAELRVVISPDATTWTPLSASPFPDVRALVTDAASVPMIATLPAPTPIRYLRIATGGYDSRVGDVAVYGE